MLLNIDKGLLIESYDYVIERLDQFVPPTEATYPSSSRSVRFVSISTIEKKYDCLHRASGIDVYHYIPVDCFRDFVDFELLFNNFFCAGGICAISAQGRAYGGQTIQPTFLALLDV